MAIIVKGTAVAFSTTENSDWRKPDFFLPRQYGIIHDPKGKQLPRCVVYFGRYKLVSGKPEVTKESLKYFGAQYPQKRVKVPTKPSLNEATWKPVARITHIFYERKGFAVGGYHHPFRGSPLVLEQSGKFYRLSLTPGSDSCIVDDRGFVFP